MNIASELEMAPQNADVSVLNGQVLRTPEQIGRQALVDETVQDVLAGLPSLQPQTVTLRTRLLRPLVEESGVVETQRQLEALLSAPVTLTAGERRWTWSQAALGDLMRLSRVTRTDTTGQRIEATLDRRLLERHLTALAQEIDVAPVEPRVHFGANGLQITQPGRDGARLETAQALEQLTVALWQAERTFALPVTVLQPQARPDTLANLGIVELVTEGKSSFEASAAYRIQNIQAGARQMEDVLIAPGAEFSFNQTVGAIDETNGFTQGYAIIDGRTQLEWGGGVCQVSTTVFRAAYWAGIPITERNQHSFRIRWYEQFEPIGMDAAIFTGPGGYDFRFVNDTGNWLLMETIADTANEVLTVNLYGTRPNREVIQTPPSIMNEIPAPTKPRYFNDPKLPAGTIRAMC
jgi:vancomycin resistance protein YoaR